MSGNGNGFKFSRRALQVMGGMVLVGAIGCVGLAVAQNGHTPASGGFNSWALRLTGGLAAAGIIGGVGLAITQSGVKTQVEANRRELAQRRVAVETIPVIVTDINHIKDDISEIRTSLAEIARGVG